MTENDDELIQRAAEMKADEWDIVAAMVRLADTPEAKDKLQDIAKKLYDQKHETNYKFEDFIDDD